MPLGNATLHSIFLTLLVVLAGCGTDGRRQAQIPAVPQPRDSGRTEAAIQALTRAINQSAPPSAYAKRAMLYLAAGRRPDALTDINEAISRNANVGTYYLTRAQVLRSLGNAPKALADAERAEIQGVDTPELYTLMGDLLQQQRQFGKAQLYLTKSLQMAPYNGETYYYGGLVAAQQGDTARALQLYQRSLQLKPRFLPTYQQLAAVYRELGNLDASLAYTTQALQYFPDDAPSHLNRGMLYQAVGRADSALMSYQRAVRLNPKLASAYFQAGILFAKLRNHGQALANFNRVRQLQATYPRIDFYIGQSLEATGQLEAATAAYGQAMAANSADQQAYWGYWRTQKRQYRPSYDNYGLPTYSAARPTLDTARVRLAPIQPRTRLSTRTDSIGRALRSPGTN